MRTLFKLLDTSINSVLLTKHHDYCDKKRYPDSTIYDSLVAPAAARAGALRTILGGRAVLRTT